MTENVINLDPFERDPTDVLISNTIQEIYKTLDTHTPSLTDDRFAEVLGKIATALQLDQRHPAVAAEFRQLLRHVREVSSAFSC